jgi:hypothetical protein
VALTLVDTLQRMSKALNLMKLGNAVGTGDLDVEVDDADPQRPTSRSCAPCPHASAHPSAR